MDPERIKLTNPQIVKLLRRLISGEIKKPGLAVLMDNDSTLMQWREGAKTYETELGTPEMLVKLFFKALKINAESV